MTSDHDLVATVPALDDDEGARTDPTLPAWAPKLLLLVGVLGVVVMVLLVR